MPYRLDIPGWMSEEDLKAIERLAAEVPANGLVVEIVTFLGRSTWAWCKSVHPSVRVIGVDTFDWVPEHESYDMQGDAYDATPGAEALFELNTRECTNLRKIVATSPNFDRGNDFADVVFIDGDHELPGIVFDLGFAFARLKPGGLLSGDDYSGAFPGVQSAVDAFSGILNKTVERLGSKLWAIRLN